MGEVLSSVVYLFLFGQAEVGMLDILAHCSRRYVTLFLVLHFLVLLLALELVSLCFSDSWRQYALFHRIHSM